MSLALGPAAARAEDTQGHPNLSAFHLGVGYVEGLEPNDDIRETHLRVGYEQVFHPALSAGPELAGELFRGERDGRRADAEGLTALYQLKWHALRARGFSWYVGFGFGGVFFFSPFPPGGTRFNGHSFFGTGVVVPLGPRWLLQADVREMHHSNGQGLVANNPAFDGLSFTLGVGWRPFVP